MSDKLSKLEWLACSRLPRWPTWAVVTLGVWVGLVALAAEISTRTGHDIVLCPMKRLTNVPCPTCGCTRSGLALLRGQVGQAFHYNPLIFTAGIVAATLLLVRVTLGRRVKLNLSSAQWKLMIVLLIAAVLANWVYVIAYVG